MKPHYTNTDNPSDFPKTKKPMNAKQRREKWLWEHRPKEYMERRAARRAEEAVFKMLIEVHSIQEKYNILKANGMIPTPIPENLKEFLLKNGVNL